jgi:DNA mismatch repair protein MutS
MAAADKLTPMQQQYRRIKREIPPDALLLFRLGDFYEMFYDDAKAASQLLNLALTARNGVPMCGIPHHAAENYIGRLLKAGRKVALCDQLEEACPGKLVNREVTQILSPGAHFDARLLHDTRHNYLAALCASGKPHHSTTPSLPHSASPQSSVPLFGLALIDLTTGDFQVTELSSSDELLTELARLQPAELIVPAEWLDDARQLFQHSNTPSLQHSISPHDGWTFEAQTAYFTLRDHFKTQSLDGFGCAGLTVGVGAAGAALHYLSQGLRRNTQHIHTLKVYAPQQFLVLDTTTQRNLEILESVRGERKTSLLGCMDRTVTPMGARLLRDWLTHPLRDAAAIEARQEVVAHFHKNAHQLTDFRETLKDVKDIERSIARLSVGSGNARDLVALKDSLRAIPELKEILENAARLSQPPLATLTETAPQSSVLAHTRTISSLREKHGDRLEQIVQREFGHGIETLTESEARHLFKATDVDTIRTRIAAARHSASVATNGGTPRGGKSEDGQVIRESITPSLHHSSTPTLLSLLTSSITPLPDLCDLIERAIVEGPPLALKEGGLIREGHNARLDELRRASREGKEWIAQLQQREIERTGIPSLKVRFNSVFGYYIEVTKTHLAKVPADYTRKQTVAGGERFITPELKEMEEKILGAEERANQLEYELFLELRKAALDQSAPVQQTAAALAQLDVLAGFADLARHQNYCRPQIENGSASVSLANGKQEPVGRQSPAADSETSAAGENRATADKSRIQNLKSKIEIVDGRHPVLEQLLTEERFVPNDTFLDNAENQILIITGPNMAGKSTYIRQVALITLMAHTGSFVPATRATVSLVDRIFSRIGATDDLARGQSTFLVEMNETANILNNATPQSLVILDEIGRGTSTFDGLSIAWAVAEHLHDAVVCKTLFATHYHELTDLARTHPRVKNYNVAVREWNEQVIFLRKVVEGGADKSYGIHVARLAGLPRPLIARAKEILANLEESELAAPHARGQSATEKTKADKAKGKRQKAKGKIQEPPPQMYLFEKRAD